jgi:hypothetical protein
MANIRFLRIFGEVKINGRTRERKPALPDANTGYLSWATVVFTFATTDSGSGA